MVLKLGHFGKFINQINDKLTVRENAIFETVIQKDPYRGLATPPQ
jgi:hypothetical protein